MLSLLTTARAAGTRVRVLLAAASALAIAACGGSGSDGTTNPPPPPPPPTGNFTLSIAGGPLTLARSTNGTVTVNMVRTGSFASPVTLSVSGLPAGVTTGLNPAQVVTGAAFSTLTLTVGANAAAGTSTVTVTGSATGVVNQSATFQLIVTAPPAQTGPFTLSLSATSHLVHPLNMLSRNPVLTITRNPGFSGSIAFSVTGLPTTLFIGFTPSATTGNSTNVLVVPVGATPNGSYTATIRGASSQGDQSVTLQLVVGPTSTGAIKWKFCSASAPRFFFAVKDGNGPWTRIMPSGTDTSFSFTLASGAGQVAEVVSEGGGYRTTIHAFTAQEMAARAASQCTLVQNVSGRTANGTFAGVTGFRTSLVGMGWWFGSANGNGAFSLLNLPPGPLDVVASRSGAVINPSEWSIDRLIVRRAQNPASGSTMPVFDFDAAEAVTPSQAAWTFVNNTTESFSLSQQFLTSSGTTAPFSLLPGVDGSPVIRTVYGVPAAQMIAGDLHQVIATILTSGPTPGSPTRASRQIVSYFRSPSNRTISFGPAMPSPTVLPVATAPAGRLRFQGTLPPEYNTGVLVDISQASSSNHFTIAASRAFLGAGTAYDLSMPDLSGAIGWDSQFAIRAGSQVQWWSNGGGPVLDFFDPRYLFSSTHSRWAGIRTGIDAPADGITYLSGRSTGTAIP